jgi:hypothetical protein
MHNGFATRALATGTLLTLGLLAGCTAVQVSPLQSVAQDVCIEENNKVLVKDFVPVLQAGFARHGITTQLHQSIARNQCSHIVTYTARRSWDGIPYLSSAEIKVLDPQRRTLASANYHLRGKGGLSLLKWQGTKTKMDPVIDQLLANVQIEQQPTSPVKPNAADSQSIDQKLRALHAENLEYEEYQRRYRQIMQSTEPQ